MTKKELNQILKAHSLWLKGSPDGKCANLEGANLEGANLRGAILEGANLRGANLEGANLSFANLEGANLEGANLEGAKLEGANLRGAILEGANLSFANLEGANLEGANLEGAKLEGANLRGAILEGANLSFANLDCANLSFANLDCANLDCANLRGANLRGANLRGAIYDEGTSFFALACPEEGAFIGFKRCEGYIVKLRITENAKRSSATSRKCRCSEAEVLSITHLDGAPADILSVSSIWDSNFIYTVGETVRVDNFCDDRWQECAPGIHFFITREEAVQFR